MNKERDNKHVILGSLAGCGLPREKSISTADDREEEEEEERAVLLVSLSFHGVTRFGESVLQRNLIMMPHKRLYHSCCSRKYCL